MGSPFRRVGWDCSFLRPWFKPFPALSFGLELSSTHLACPGTGKSGLASAGLPRTRAEEPGLGLAGADVPSDSGPDFLPCPCCLPVLGSGGPGSASLSCLETVNHSFQGCWGFPSSPTHTCSECQGFPPEATPQICLLLPPFLSLLSAGLPVFLLLPRAQPTPLLCDLLTRIPFAG